MEEAGKFPSARGGGCGFGSQPRAYEGQDPELQVRRKIERASKIKVKRRPASGRFVLKRLLNLTRSQMLVIAHNCSGGSR